MPGGSTSSGGFEASGGSAGSTSSGGFEAGGGSAGSTGGAGGSFGSGGSAGSTGGASGGTGMRGRPQKVNAQLVTDTGSQFIGTAYSPNFRDLGDHGPANTDCTNSPESSGLPKSCASIVQSVKDNGGNVLHVYAGLPSTPPSADSYTVDQLVSDAAEQGIYVLLTTSENYPTSLKDSSLMEPDLVALT